MFFLAVAGLVLGAGGVAVAETPTSGLLRFPDIHGDTIVFVSGEDIWSVPSSGGVASRLTLNDGEERFPKLSPDGTQIAFTGEYDGNADVYVMGIHGGGITRVTWHPGYDEVVGWHPTSGKILFRSARHSFNRFYRLFLISPDGTGLEELPLHEAAQGSYSPDGSRIAYNRGSREARTWKRYRGGTAQDVYVYDFETAMDRKLTDFPGTDRIPMWIGDRIYFSSDRDRTLNLYSLDPASGEVAQLTTHTEYDVRRPSMGGDQIVYELGGSLQVLDTKTGRTRAVPVEVRADAPEARPRSEKVTDFIQGLSISPTGKRALVTARGEVFTVPRKKGPTRNLTRDSGARDKDAAWSPDGRRVAYISDKSGEYEIYVVDPSGRSEATRLTTHTSGYRHTLRWSPDSRKIAYADQTLRCFVLDVETKQITEVDRAEYEHIDVSVDLKPISDFSWSPDSRYLAYSKLGADLLYQLHVYSLAEGQARRVSDGRFNDFGPVWTRDGRHLLFVSNRHFDPTFGDFEWQMVYKKVAGVYALTLDKDGAPLLPLESDEETPAGEEVEAEPSDQPEGGGAPVAVQIDFEGLAGRIEALPLDPGNYRSLQAGDGVVFYLNRESGDFNRFEFRVPEDMDLHRFSFEDREDTLVFPGIGGYALSADASHLAYRKGTDVGILPADAAGGPGVGKEHNLDLSHLEMRLDPRAEWSQIFYEAWRLQRDFYYDPNMHGIDWAAMRERYGRLLPRASCRQDVSFLVGEMLGELNTSHTYVMGGDRQRRAETRNIGMLGVDWEIDAGSNRYRFGRLFRVPDWTQGIEPPLARPGVDVREGDVLLSVNGVDVTADRNIYGYFEGLAGQQVRIEVAPDGSRGSTAARAYTVKPLSGEFTLRYLDWVERNRATCEARSGGQIGYIHLPDTYVASAREFPKTYYAQLRKKALVIDGRFNGGGLDPYIFLRRLRTEPLAYWTRRYSHDQTIPDLLITRAHMAMLTNRQAGSGGDMLPMEFQMLKMGPVIGTRTWGGLVGVSMFYPMIDGGGLTAPDYRIYTPDGKWIVENEGVTPDIEVDLEPAEVARGYDAQLMKAIEVLLEKLEEDPRPWPEHPPFQVDE